MGEPGQEKMISVFSWAKVDPELVRAMLATTYREAGRDDQLHVLKALSASALRANAELWLGTPPLKKRFSPAMVKLIRTEWLPKANEEHLDWLVFAMGGEPGTGTLVTKKARLAFIQDHRYVTAKLTLHIRKAFLAAHKAKQPVAAKPQGNKVLMGPVVLAGAGQPMDHEWFQHQVIAQRNLDRFWRARDLHACLVLPTGAGKTDTVAGWLLKLMASDPELQVLWLVHQQELASQAISRFVALAASQPKSFRRQARAVFTGACSVSTFADPKLCVAAVTYQSFRKLDRGKTAPLERFLARPTIVVVDEAHHVGAPSYDALLEVVCQAPGVRGVVGLTATPFPTSAVAQQRFRQRFPKIVHKVSVFELIRKEILARPFVTPFDTGVSMRLTDSELQQTYRSDLPMEVLQRLKGAAGRNQLIVHAWMNEAARWGKTLLFAVSIQHADHLAHMLEDSGAKVKALHSKSAARYEVLNWFRRLPTDSPAVLVSVGMLTEGVDLPDARTAFLARPTTSPILMRQMVGRVLRGPKAGGQSKAHIVHFRDNWHNLPDVLEPEEVLPAAVSLPEAVTDEAWAPGSLLTDEELIHKERLAVQVKRALSRLESMFNTEDLDPFNDRPLDPMLREVSIVGYYEIDEEEFPVFDHQEEPLARLLRDAVGSDLKGVPFLSYFEDGPPPYPSQRSLNRLVEAARLYGEPPALRPFPLSVSPREIARKIVERNLSARTMGHLLEKAYQDPLARTLYRSVEALDRAVSEQLWQLRRKVPYPTPEESIPGVIHPALLPKLARAKRELDEPERIAIEGAKRLLPPTMADRLKDHPKASWTKRVNEATFAHWSLKLAKANKGQAEIKVNLLLCAPKSKVSDDVLAYLIYHELLHHLLPGQGHDTEFREYEARWPGAVDHNSWLDTLHEKYDTRPERYA